MRAGTRWVHVPVQKHRGEPDTQDRHAKLMTEKCVQLGACAFVRECQRSRCSRLRCCAARTHVMVDNPDIDVVYR